MGGKPGISYASSVNRRGDHGSFSPTDTRISLLARGPGFKVGLYNNLPTANVDIAPTVAHILKLNMPDVQGRVLEEALQGGPTFTDFSVLRKTRRSSTRTGLNTKLPTDLDAAASIQDSPRMQSSYKPKCSAAAAEDIPISITRERSGSRMANGEPATTSRGDEYFNFVSVSKPRPPDNERLFLSGTAKLVCFVSSRLSGSGYQSTNGIHLPTLPRSGDRTRLRQSSPQKREFPRSGLETFGRFSLKLSIFGFLETTAIYKNPRKMQGFRAEIDHNLRSIECVAGHAVLIAPVSSQIPCKQGIFQGIGGIW